MKKQITDSNETPELYSEDIPKINYPFTGSITEVDSSVVLTEKESKIEELKALHANKNGLEITIKSMNKALESTSSSGTSGTTGQSYL